MEYLLNSSDRLLFKNVSGIYALKYQDEIFYIGKSINLYNRLTDHNKPSQFDTILKKIIKEDGNCNRCKSLAMYYLIKEHHNEIKFIILQKCKKDELDFYEEEYISKYLPRFNYRGVIVAYQV